MKRTIALLLVVAGLAALIFGIAQHKPSRLDHEEFAAYAHRTEKASGLAPIQLWDEAPPEVKGAERAERTARLSLAGGQVFSGDAHIPTDKLREFLNTRVQQDNVLYVLVFAQKGTRWGEVFPVLDECRKSRVRLVLINTIES